MTISKKLNALIQNLIATPEYWKMNYYMRSMKKAPHGGVFYSAHPNMFMRYLSIPTYLFLTQGAEIPIPVSDVSAKIRGMVDDADIDTEELLRFCLGIDPDDPGNPHNGSRMYLATCGNIITSYKHDEMERVAAVTDAIEGRICFSRGNFSIDSERLVLAFTFTLMELSIYKIRNLNEIVGHEVLSLPVDKYGLSDITDAVFERQGFKLQDKYYLYNIFLDTSIGSPTAKAPRIIEIIRSVKPHVKILMRCDDNLAVPYSQMVSNATVDFQKWRGITLTFNSITEQLKRGKETVVHYNTQTLHKILVYVRRGNDEAGAEFYHINVEQLWNLEIFNTADTVIVTNYIHGTYYPSSESFEHIDFSVNQYSREIFEAKYRDAENLTGITIDKYGDEHYKVWCVRGDHLTPALWADLVCSSLDAPFRSIFMETIGGTYAEEEN